MSLIRPIEPVSYRHICRQEAKKSLHTCPSYVPNMPLICP